MALEHQVGSFISRLRKERGMTLETLAQRTGLTKGYLSKVERALKTPPVSTLSRIAVALGVEMSDFFERPATFPQLTLVRRGERRLISADCSAYGYAYESVAFNHSHKLMEPFILTFLPDAKIDEMFTHPGEEFIYVLDGRMLFIHGEERVVCEEGDALYFDAAVPHRGECLGEEETRVLIVMASANNRFP